MTSTPSDSAGPALTGDAEEPGSDPGPGQEPEVEAPGADEQGDGELPPGPPERVRTGSDRVDEVIRAVEELDDRPLEEHVGVFESAHVQLRRALDDPGDDDHADDHPGHG